MLLLGSEREPAGAGQGQEGLAEIVRGPWSACQRRHAAAAQSSQALLPTLREAPSHTESGPLAPALGPPAIPRGDHHGTRLLEHLRITAPGSAPGRTVSHKGGNGWLEQRRNGPRHEGC